MPPTRRALARRRPLGARGSVPQATSPRPQLAVPLRDGAPWVRGALSRKLRRHALNSSCPCAAAPHGCAWLQAAWPGRGPCGALLVARRAESDRSYVAGASKREELIRVSPRSAGGDFAKPPKSAGQQRGMLRGRAPGWAAPTRPALPDSKGLTRGARGRALDGQRFRSPDRFEARQTRGRMGRRDTERGRRRAA